MTDTPPPASSPEGLFAALAQEHLADPDVTTGRMLKAEGLKVHGKVFAFLTDGGLVVKVPAAQAAELVDGGRAVRVETVPGRVMREWVRVPVPSAAEGDAPWRALMSDARTYVAALAQS